MRICDFECLPHDVKTSYVWDHGICVQQKLEQGKGICCIFYVDGFFVETIYSTGDNAVNNIRPLTEYCRWEAYVDRQIRGAIWLS